MGDRKKALILCEFEFVRKERLIKSNGISDRGTSLPKYYKTRFLNFLIKERYSLYTAIPTKCSGYLYFICREEYSLQDFKNDELCVKSVSLTLWKTILSLIICTT